MERHENRIPSTPLEEHKHKNIWVCAKCKPTKEQHSALTPVAPRRWCNCRSWNPALGPRPSRSLQHFAGENPTQHPLPLPNHNPSTWDPEVLWPKHQSCAFFLSTVLLVDHTQRHVHLSGRAPKEWLPGEACDRWR